MATMDTSRRPIEDSFVEQLKSTADILGVIGNSVKLKPSGGGRYMGLCPFHEEKTPSFSVNTADNLYHCFGCKESGDILKFIMTTEGMDFYDAIHRLAELQGLQVQYKSAATGKMSEQRQQDYDLVRLAADFYAAQLPQHKQAQDYFAARGIHRQLIAEYQLGYAPPGYDNLLKQLTSEAQKETALRLGLIKSNTQGSYDVLRDRVIFPIVDLRRRPIGFGGRVISDANKEAKYINSADSDIFHKQQQMFGLPQALASKVNQRLTVVEGYMDVLALAGIDRAVASLGTAFSAYHAELLFSRVDKVLLAFDGDEAGIKAAERALLQCLPVLKDSQELLLKLLPPGRDPFDVVAAPDSESGKKAWQQVPELRLEDYLLRPFNSAMSPAAARVAINNLAEILAQMPPGSTRAALVQQKAEQLLGGIRISIAAKADNSRQGAKRSSSETKVGAKVMAKPASLEQKLLFQLLNNCRSGTKLLDRWGAKLEQAAAMTKGYEARQTLQLIQAARRGTAYLYGYAAGLGFPFSAGSPAWDGSAHDCIQKILLQVYNAELKYAINLADREQQKKVREMIAQLKHPSAASFLGPSRH